MSAASSAAQIPPAKQPAGDGHDVEKVAQAKPEVDESEDNFKPKTLKFWAVLISIFLALFLVAIDRTIIGTAIPQITVDFQSLGDVGWYGSAYQLTTSASQLIFGRVYKFYETKRTFLWCVAIFEIGSVICGAAPNSTAFIIGRAVAGLGSAGIFSGVMIIMIPMIPLRKRPMFQGIFGTVFGLASVMGPLIGGGFTDGVSWRWCFYINLPIGAVVVACLMLILKIPVKTTPPATVREQVVRLDPLGTFLFVPSIVSLLLALQWGGSTYAWNSARAIALLVVFAVLFLAFTAVQILNPNATVPPRVITQRSILAGTFFMFSLAGSMLMSIYFVPLWFQVVQGVSAVKSGIYTLPFVLSLVVASIMSGAFTQKIGYYVPAMLMSPSVMAVGQGLMSTFRVHESSSHWIGYQLITGFGLGIGMQASGLAAQAVLPKPDIPIGISIMFFAQQLGGAIFTSVGQNLLSNQLADQLAGIPGLDPSSVNGEGATDLVNQVPAENRQAVLEIYNHALTRIFLCGMGVALVGTVAALFMEWKNIKKTGPPRASPGSSDPPEGMQSTKAISDIEPPRIPTPKSLEQSANPVDETSTVYSAELSKPHDIQSARQSAADTLVAEPFEPSRDQFQELDLAQTPSHK
ncbi:putative efflux pump antibiotic resistance protein [Pseudomassariella vexata]|uniref:Putative efflux pump antibiotic resistance protein n=1 Tax=Pseudomassariella vexata TaxID=1141098 RepID=A0A1Y2E130_9PEZI|nr:putative efflux pump antibiotic resistance protein [Pseudomassariella vexata]ORY65263.1 putative efflux pump antibiotic resistance protein [Pseudomassariella vexata]